MMLRDSLYIGESPWGEECAQVGDDLYTQRATQECQRFIDQIRRHYGDEPKGARLYVKSNPHDFGSYLSVECEFTFDPNDDGDEWARLNPAQDYAFAIECDSKGVLERWDDELSV